MLIADIDAQVANYMNGIKSTFKELHQSLDQRQEQLTQQLLKVANTKKEKLQNASNMMNQRRDSSKQVCNMLFSCVSVA